MYYGKAALFPAARFSNWETEKFWARGLAFLAQKARQEQGEQGDFWQGHGDRVWACFERVHRSDKPVKERGYSASSYPKPTTVALLR